MAHVAGGTAGLCFEVAGGAGAARLAWLTHPNFCRSRISVTGICSRKHADVNVGRRIARISERCVRRFPNATRSPEQTQVGSAITSAWDVKKSRPQPRHERSREEDRPPFLSDGPRLPRSCAFRRTTFPPAPLPPESLFHPPPSSLVSRIAPHRFAPPRPQCRPTRPTTPRSTHPRRSSPPPPRKCPSPSPLLTATTPRLRIT